MAMSRSLGGRSFTTRSPMAISPAVISSSPATMRRVVVLPQPDGPTRTMNSLSRIVRLTSLTACTSSYFLFRSLSTTCAMGDLFRSGYVGHRRGGPRPPRPGILAQPDGRGYLGLSLDGAGESRDVILDEERVDDGHGDGAEQGARHELSPEVDVAADQLGDHAHGHRFLLRRGEEDQGVDELVPGQGEGEDPRGEDAGNGDGEDEPDHGPEARGAVDARALLELLGNGLEVAHEEPRAKGDKEGRIG